MVGKYSLGFVGIALLTACGSDVDTGGSTSAAVGSGGAGGDTTSVGGGATTSGTGGMTAAECFEDIHYTIDRKYDQFNPVIGSHCKGTNHQDIDGIERVVFLGDSITQGTPPTPGGQVYRAVLSEKLAAKFPGVVIDECAVNGARVGDFLGGDNQIPNCFPGPEMRKTLVIITMGGNDVIGWAEKKLPVDEAKKDAEDIAATFRQAIEWFYDDPAKFPNGVQVVFSNVYEYTDGTGDLSSCLAANFIGLSGDYLEGAVALGYLEEQYMSIAVETQTDMIFLLESFCGHGFRRNDPDISCYRGPNAESWFDISCIHPTPAGHAALADLFFAVIEE